MNDYERYFSKFRWCVAVYIALLLPRTDLTQWLAVIVLLVAAVYCSKGWSAKRSSKNWLDAMLELQKNRDKRRDD